MNQGNQMNLGRQPFKDGILIVFARKEGQLRTEVGVGLDKIITNQVSSLINETVMAPHLSAGQYGLAFYNGAMAVKERIVLDRKLIGK